MLGKKLMVSAMATSLLWAAGAAGHAVVANHPGLLLLAGQVRLSLGDREGGLRWMWSAAQQGETSPADTLAAASAPASSTPVRTLSAKCTPDGRVNRVAPPSSRSARLVTAGERVLPADFAGQMARRERRLARLSLEQTRLSHQMQVRVLQRLRDLPQPPLPAEPLRANP